MKLTTVCLVLYCGVALAAAYNTRKGTPELLRVCYYTASNPVPRPLNASLCTHIIVGFSSVQDGLLNLGPESYRRVYQDTVDLKQQNPVLKVLLTVGGGGNDAGFSLAVNSTWNRTKFIASILISLGKYDFDGLDVDWEFPVWNDKVKGDKQNFVHFLKEFKYWAKYFARFVRKPLALLSVAVAAPKTIVDVSYNITEMAKYVDFVNLMSYDFHDYFWYTPCTGHNSPLFNRSAEKYYFATLNTAWSAYYWHQRGMPKSKIMVGIPTYAHTYVLQDPLINGVDAPATGTKGDINFPDVCKLLQSGGTRVFDNESQVPYAYKAHDWVSYEDDVSILGKAKWIKAEGFGGSMTYSLNCDDWAGICGKTPFILQRIIYDVFTGVG